MKNLLQFWPRIKNRYGRRRSNTLAVLLIAGIAAILVRLVIHAGQQNSAILYMLIPYGISILIATLRSYDRPSTLRGGYVSHMTTALLVFLATALFLGEGVICAAMFFPIYVFMVSLAYLTRWWMSRKRTKSGKLYTSVIPLLVLLLSFEGTTEFLSYSRDSQVEVSRQTSLSVESVKANLALPISLDKKRHWLLAMFAMPYEIKAGTLNEGDIHHIKTRYHRWLFTNTHEGEAKLLIEHVGEQSVRTRILSDTTYFASYIQLYGTEIDLQPQENSETRITLRLNYERKLDPAWYFHPLQQFALAKMAEFLIQEVMIRD